MTERGVCSRQILWEEGDGGRYPYHVYGLHETTRGTVLAFSEARIERGDAGDHDLVLKRGERLSDGTISWGGTILIENGNDDGGTCWANPTGLTDRQSGRLFFFYVKNDGTADQRTRRVFYKTSEDDGRTWGDRSEITGLFSDNRYNGFNWTFHMPGPGHGIQLRNQPVKELNGRLLVQFWHRGAISSKPRRYGVSVIYSDNNGVTWQNGGDCGIGLNMNESRIAELSDGTILLCARGSRDGGIDNSHSRIYAWSRNGGGTFSPPDERDSLPYTGCDSGLLAVNRNGTEYLLLSHPGDLDSRTRMVISASPDLGKTWSRHRVIDTGRACYSDMVLLSDGTIGLLWGQGKSAAYKAAGWFSRPGCVFSN